MSPKTLVIAWVTQGEITWEDWWIQQYGRTRTRIPNKNDYISFANFDLQRVGNFKIIEEEGCLDIPTVPEEYITAVSDILYFHGFEVISIQDK